MLRKHVLVTLMLIGCLPSAALANTEYWEKEIKIQIKSTKLPSGLPAGYNKDFADVQATASTVQLAASGAPDLVLEYQTQSHNQPVQIYQNEGGKYRLILDDSDQSWYALSEIVNGRHTVVVRAHNSAAESNVRIYQYNGKKYSMVKELDVTCLDPNDPDCKKRTIVRIMH